jgi:hypothetical protein
MEQGQKIPQKTRAKIAKDLGRLAYREIARKYNISTSSVSEIKKEMYVGQTEAPITKLRRTEIQWLFNHFCKHGNRYTEHYDCFLKEKKGIIGGQRTAFYDIEASNLSADFGICICYKMKILGEDKVFGSTITPKDLKDKVYDRRIIENFIKDCKKCDRLIGHYSSRFDTPYMRTRAVILGIDNFPAFGELYETDTWRIARQKLKLSSNRLKTIETAFNLKDNKTAIKPEHWLGALTGHQPDIDYIDEHCVLDVKVLEAVYKKIEKYAFKANTSI